MKYSFFPLSIILLGVLTVSCMDTEKSSIPGAKDSLHHFDAADYTIIQTLPDSLGFQLLSATLEGKSNNRLLLDLALNKMNSRYKTNCAYSFPVITTSKSHHGRTIKPEHEVINEKTDIDSLSRKQLRYAIYGIKSADRVYIRVPNQDSLLLELPGI